MWHKIPGIELKTGITYEISDDWTVVSVNAKGERKILKPDNGRVRLAETSYMLYDLAKLVGLPPKEWPEDERDYHELKNVSEDLGIRYRVFRDGTVQRMDQHGNVKNMTHTTTANGYITVKIGGNDIRLHQLMGELFVPKPENMPDDWTVHHVDKNPKNNHADNLEWASSSTQRIDQRPTEQHRIVSCPVVGTATRDVVLKNGDLIRKGEAVEFASMHAAIGAIIDGCQGHISGCLNNRAGRKSHAGFAWSVPSGDRELPGEEFVSVNSGIQAERLISQFGRIQYKFHNGYVKILLAASMMTDRKKRETNSYPEIHIDGRNKLIHRIVINIFVGKVPEKIVINGKSHRLVVDHIDDDKKNARVGNLQLLTNQENVQKKHLESYETSVASFYNGAHEYHSTRESAIEYVKSRGFPGASLEELNAAIVRMTTENIVAKLYGRTWIRAHFV